METPSATPFLFEATQENFARVVLENSRQAPVLVDFWAPWCAPCRALSPVLEHLAQHYQGKLMIAKVNTEEQQALAAEYGIRSLPTVKLFRNGVAVGEFMGLRPAADVQKFVEPHIQRDSDVVRTRAAEAFTKGDAERARELLEKARLMDPDIPDITLELAYAETVLGNVERAEALLKSLPAETAMTPGARALTARVTFARAAKDAPRTDVLLKTVEENPLNLDARYVLAVRELLEGREQEGLDQFIEIMRQNMHYKEGLGKQSLIAAFDMLADKEHLVRDYRRKFSMLLH